MSVLEQVDHLVYATPDLDQTVSELEKRLGVRASPGGKHPGRGTRNALLAIGPASYLEIVGPDPEQNLPAHSLWFGIDDLTQPRLVTWAAKAAGLDQFVSAAAQRGVKVGPVTQGNRERSDGVLLSWHFTEPTVIHEDGLLPFFIDWRSSAHPAASAATGAELIGFSAEHPYPLRVAAYLAALELELPVAYAPVAALVAVFRTATGEIVLR